MREFHFWIVVWGAATGAATAVSGVLPLRGIGLVLGLIVGGAAAYHAGQVLRRDRDARAAR